MRELALALMLCTTYLECRASDHKEIDQLCRKYCVSELRAQSNLPRGSTIDANRKLFIERMLELDDKEMNAHFAKDMIQRNLRMYKGFLSTKKSWMNSDLTEDDTKRFTALVEELEDAYDKIESVYPTDLEVFDRVRSQADLPGNGKANKPAHTTPDPP